MTVITISANTTGAHIGDNTNTEDTYLDQGSPTLHDGAALAVFVRDGATSNSQNALIGFSGLSAIPGGSTINSATLYIYKQGGNANPFTMDAYALLKSWGEGTANWNTTDGTTAWSSGGATGSGTDIASAYTGQIVCTTSGLYSLSNAQLATDIANGVTSWNLIYDTPTASGNWNSFTSKEGTDGNRPALVVDYTAGTGSWLNRNYFWGEY